jgi:hypothetical protein
MLPINFQFSQASLQDYVDCPRRFQLRYLKKLAWPAVEAEPLEEQEARIQLGLEFHRMVQRHLMGIPVDVLEKYLVDDHLTTWWQNYKVYRPYEQRGQTYTELMLTLPVLAYRLSAKFDLLIVNPGNRLLIVDWKTTQFLPRKVQLEQRMQTRVYRYVCALAGAHLYHGHPLKPEEIEMMYWFPQFPASPIRLPYTAEHYEADHCTLTGLITEIQDLPDDEFRLTTDTRRCAYCRFRTYCGTGENAGRIESYEQVSDVGEEEDEFDFEQIAEIEF